jgi:hypothetical protein
VLNVKKEVDMTKTYLLLSMSLFLISTFSSGCASIMCGSEKTINIKSHPLESEYTITNRKGEIIAKGTTPENITLKRGSGWFKGGDYTITLEKHGYETEVKPISQGVETGWYGLGNILFGGLIGWVIVDPLTGGMYNIRDVNISLERDDSVVLLSDYTQNNGENKVTLNRKIQKEALEAARRTKNCTHCGKLFGKKDSVRLYKLKRVCRDCLNKLKS